MRSASESEGRRPIPPPSTGTSPAAVAIIMDGNGRWADARGAASRGPPRRHRALRRIVEAAIELGIETSRLRVLDRELARPADEVADSCCCFVEKIVARAARPRQEGRADRLLGRATAGPWLEADGGARGRDASPTTRLNLWMAFDYGGREELSRRRGARRAAVSSDDVDEHARRLLYVPELPTRTS